MTTYIPSTSRPLMRFTEGMGSSLIASPLAHESASSLDRRYRRLVEARSKPRPLPATPSFPPDEDANDVTP